VAASVEAVGAFPERVAALAVLGVGVLPTPWLDGRGPLQNAGAWREVSPEARGLDLGQLLQSLAARGVSSLLVEGGATTLGAFVDAGLVDAWVAHIAPVLVGGAGALSPLGGLGVGELSALSRLGPLRVTPLGPDLEVAAGVGGGDVYGLD
jgi:riboflavin biosynthesis pyrimidine reductase